MVAFGWLSVTFLRSEECPAGAGCTFDDKTMLLPPCHDAECLGVAAICCKDCTTIANVSSKRPVRFRTGEVLVVNSCVAFLNLLVYLFVIYDRVRNRKLSGFNGEQFKSHHCLVGLPVTIHIVFICASSIFTAVYAKKEWKEVHAQCSPILMFIISVLSVHFVTLIHFCGANIPPLSRNKHRLPCVRTISNVFDALLVIWWVVLAVYTWGKI